MTLTAAEALALAVQSRTQSLDSIYQNITTEASAGNSTILLDSSELNSDIENALTTNGFVITVVGEGTKSISWAPTT